VREPRTRRRARVIAVFNPRGRVAMIATDARSHRAGGVQVHDRRGGKAIQLKRAGKRSRFVYGVRKGRVRYVAVASKPVAKSPRKLRRYLRLAGLPASN
jgi:hypothetical protein